MIFGDVIVQAAGSKQHLWVCVMVIDVLRNCTMSLAACTNARRECASFQTWKRKLQREFLSFFCSAGFFLPLQTDRLVFPSSLKSLFSRRLFFSLSFALNDEIANSVPTSLVSCSGGFFSFSLLVLSLSILQIRSPFFSAVTEEWVMQFLSQAPLSRHSCTFTVLSLKN